MNDNVVLHVIESCSGGSLRYLVQICNNLSGKWRNVVVFSKRADTPSNLFSFFPENTEFIEIKMLREINIKVDLNNIIELRSIINRINPAIIHLHSTKAGILGRIAQCINYKSSAKVLYTPHGFSFFRKDITKIKRLIYWWIEFLVAKVSRFYFLVGSDEEYRQALKLKSKKNCFLVYNSVHISPSYDIPLKCIHPTIITIGRITKAKNWELFVRVAHKVKEHYSEISFVWVGDGEDKHLLEDYAKNINVDIKITGWVDQNEVRTYLKNSDIYIQTSSWEGLPYSLLEAMSAGKPPVVSNIQAHRDIIINSVNGFIAIDVNHFAEIILLLVRNSNLRCNISKSARQLVKEKYSLEAFISHIQKLYIDLIKRDV